MEDCDVDWRVSADFSQVPHHPLLMVGVGDVDRLNQESGRFDARLVVFELDVKREGVSRVKPVLKVTKERLDLQL